MAQRHSPIDLNDHIPALCLALGSKIALHAKRNGAAPLNLDLSEWRIVQVLGALEQCTIFDIADRIAIDRGGTSRAVLSLERNGYVVRKSDSADRRRSFVTLTKEGWQLHRKVVAFSRAREERLLKGVSNADQRRLRGLLNALIGEAHLMLDEAWVPPKT